LRRAAAFSVSRTQRKGFKGEGKMAKASQEKAKEMEERAKANVQKNAPEGITFEKLLSRAYESACKIGEAKAIPVEKITGNSFTSLYNSISQFDFIRYNGKSQTEILRAFDAFAGKTNLIHAKRTTKEQDDNPEQGQDDNEKKRKAPEIINVPDGDMIPGAFSVMRLSAEQEDPFKLVHQILDGKEGEETVNHFIMFSQWQCTATGDQEGLADWFVEQEGMPGSGKQWLKRIEHMKETLKQAILFDEKTQGSTLRDASEYAKRPGGCYILNPAYTPKRMYRKQEQKDQIR
jgi:hypothetical protein